MSKHIVEQYRQPTIPKTKAVIQSNDVRDQKKVHDSLVGEVHRIRNELEVLSRENKKLSNKVARLEIEIFNLRNRRR